MSLLHEDTHAVPASWYLYTTDGCATTTGVAVIGHVGGFVRPVSLFENAVSMPAKRHERMLIEEAPEAPERPIQRQARVHPGTTMLVPWTVGQQTLFPVSCWPSGHSSL